MNNLKKTLLSIAALLLLPGINFLSAEDFKWPIRTERKILISSVFGESRIDHFHGSLDMPGADLKVYPVKSGRLLYYTSGEPKSGELPFGGGGTMVIEHEKTWSTYMHFERVRDEIFKQKSIRQNDVIGYTGDTGHSGGYHLDFSIYNYKNKRKYNPLLILPSRYYRNESPPEIDAFAVDVPEEGLTRVTIGSVFKMKGDYPLYLRINDTGTGRERWGIYTLKAYAGDELIREYKFDYIEFKDGRWRDRNGYSFDEVFNGRYYNLGSGYKRIRSVRVETAGLHGPALKRTIELNIKGD